MALKELPSSLRRLAVKDARSSISFVRNCRRYASTEAAPKDASQDMQDLESTSSYSPMSVAENEHVDSYDPVKKVQQRKTQLPASRYDVRTIGLKLHGLKYSLDISINHHDTTVDHFIHTNLPRNQTLHPENMFQDLSIMLD